MAVTVVDFVEFVIPLCLEVRKTGFSSVTWFKIVQHQHVAQLLK